MYVAARVDDMIAAGDSLGEAAWKRIRHAIRVLQTTTPREGDGLHRKTAIRAWNAVSRWNSGRALASLRFSSERGFCGVQDFLAALTRSDI